jgi:hypothetical protein
MAEGEKGIPNLVPQVYTRYAIVVHPLANPYFHSQDQGSFSNRHRTLHVDVERKVGYSGHLAS